VKIVTYNVNGIRAASKKGFLEWVATHKPDVLCLQEVKAFEKDAPLAALTALGYGWVWHAASKPGYSGVATFYLDSAKLVSSITASGHALTDTEGRVLETCHETVAGRRFSVVNVYAPSGTTGGVRQEVKYAFLAHFLPHLQARALATGSLVVCGDFNIAATEQDIHNPKANAKSSGFLPEERAWLVTLAEAGFSDPYRTLYPEGSEYSWWTYRAGARERNLGWRIDHFWLSVSLAFLAKSVFHYKELLASDHAPVMLELALD
jgi:exodeoxyribonuclease III